MTWIRYAKSLKTMQQSIREPVEEDHESEGLGLVFYYTSEETDPYVYCMEQDDFGITYHRFSRPDYNKLVSEDNEIKHNAQECIMCK